MTIPPLTRSGYRLLPEGYGMRCRLTVVLPQDVIDIVVLELQSRGH
jgi:hypothetical protein